MIKVLIRKPGSIWTVTKHSYSLVWKRLRLCDLPSCYCFLYPIKGYHYKRLCNNEKKKTFKLPGRDHPHFLYHVQNVRSIRFCNTLASNWVLHLLFPFSVPNLLGFVRSGTAYQWSWSSIGIRFPLVLQILGTTVVNVMLFVNLVPSIDAWISSLQRFFQMHARAHVLINRQNLKFDSHFAQQFLNVKTTSTLTVLAHTGLVGSSSSHNLSVYFISFIFCLPPTLLNQPAVSIFWLRSFSSLDQLLSGPFSSFSFPVPCDTSATHMSKWCCAL